MAPWLANAVLLAHAAVVVFVVGLLPLIFIGGARGWRWVRRPALRFAHLALIVFITVQAWLGRVCPLTTWENALRAGSEAAYDGGFIQHWVSRALYWDAPAWVFTLAYSAFALAVIAAWWRVPPNTRRR